MDTPKISILKHTGEKDRFDVSKLRTSLERTGAKSTTISRVIDQVIVDLYDGITTQEIYQKAHQLLKIQESSKASRYRLKQSILELGPTGYPFELFVGELMKAEGFTVKVGEIQPGRCVNHEVDILAENEREVLMLECKFHNRQAYKTDVKVPLYVHSRFRDLQAGWNNDHAFKNKSHKGGVVTNARFTVDALDYGRCSGLRMVSWDYPNDHSLRNLIDRHQLYPITSLTHLTKKQKQELMEFNIISIRSLCSNLCVLDQLGLSNSKKEKIIASANLICER